MNTVTREQFEAAIGTLLRAHPASDIVRAPRDRTNRGWIRLVADNEAITTIELGAAPDPAYAWVPGEVFVDVGMATDHPLVAELDETALENLTAADLLGTERVHALSYEAWSLWQHEEGC